MSAAAANAGTGRRSWLARLAAGAPVRVYVLAGRNPPGEPEDLRLDARIELLDSPRSASVLLVAGVLPAPLHEAAKRAHDAMATPRHVVLWQQAADATDTSTVPFREPRRIHEKDDLPAGLVVVQRDLLGGHLHSSPPLLPDVDPAPWRGVGPYGQGGSGMTGGVPYGRALAERAPDRDGLELDQLPVRIGPFFPAFPSGLVLDLKLQGDVVQDVTIEANAFDNGTAPRTADVFHLALTRPVNVAELERARASHHLRWLAHAVRVAGLPSIGLRARAVAQMAAHAPALEVLRSARTLRRHVERSGVFRWTLRGVGSIDQARLAARGLGPIARASGLAEDARLDDPGYRALSFEPVVQPTTSNGDAGARWRQRLDEIEQSLTLAARADTSTTGGRGSVEGPHGLIQRDSSESDDVTELIPELLRGMEWGDAVTTIVSLDLNLVAGSVLQRSASNASSHQHAHGG